MQCEEHGVTVAHDRTTVQSADYYECPECGHGVLIQAGTCVSVELAEKLYNREVGQSRTMFRLDKGECVPAGARLTEITNNAG